VDGIVKRRSNLGVRSSSSQKMMEEEGMDAENRRLTDGLSAQVKQLKGLAYDIEEEAKEHNRYIDGMGWNFDSTQNLLSGGVNRVHKLLGTNRGNRRIMCYIIAIVVVAGLVFYHVTSRVTSQSKENEVQ